MILPENSLFSENKKPPVILGAYREKRKRAEERRIGIPFFYHQFYNIAGDRLVPGNHRRQRKFYDFSEARKGAEFSAVWSS
jgi:hypothetical protein